MSTSELVIKKLLKNPEKIIKDYNLIYVKDKDFPIIRKKWGKGFTYSYNGKTLKDRNELKRIKSLVIPPMWNEVKITHLKSGHLQAMGRDAKQRKQYKYHPKWIKIRNQTKFYKMSAFGKQLPLIRKQVDADLDQKGWPKSKVIALVIRLMEETHIRIGNEQYAKRNKSYGLSTLRKRHVEVNKSKLKFEFVGKKGKEHSVTVRNKKLIKLVSRCEEIPGWELFKYYDENGEKQSVESSMVNEYLHKISGEFFSAKDFRTWAASVIFFETLMELEKPSTDKQRNKNILAGIDAVAQQLGNTRNVCRKYYVHPMLVSAYEKETLATYFELAQNKFKNEDYLTASEKAILQLINNYSPKF
ncbi:DNA topoisomerase IB [Aureibaculum sp. 2210JD6-5]|uniref:DNA topoisomerase IB n=1 Tax=Aureibaculum sp. 2210JD6-5 TaxID=3103957 RepID=UPI002AAD5319|nr:DNA topoisomerase IB [Aureibaculum sp. 2210JD6-5]MDY7394982.1 DNA topoisomerase IB [Aureibaculum sp. 2210JD6-5]